jgi:predicted RNase H-like nuclease
MNRSGIEPCQSSAKREGCAGGWVCLALDLKTGEVCPHLLSDFRTVLEAFLAALIGVDITIGLSDRGSRQCDVDARRLLGKRGSSVFPAPVRGMLAATSYEEACQLGRQINGRSISCQCYGILPKIREVDCAMSPQLQQRVFEVHPEVCFWAMNQCIPMQYAKIFIDGRRERLDLLRPIIPVIEGIHVDGRAAKDDLLDAAAVMWTAERIFRGEAVGVTTIEEFDSKGLRMQITY